MVYGVFASKRRYGRKAESTCRAGFVKAGMANSRLQAARRRRILSPSHRMPMATRKKSAKKPAQEKPAQQMTTADAVVGTLIAHGIDTIYALPGVQNDHLFDALFRAADKLRTVHPRHQPPAGLRRRAGPGFAQRRTRPAHGLLHQRAGTRPGRANSPRRYRPR